MTEEPETTTPVFSLDAHKYKLGTTENLRTVIQQSIDRLALIPERGNQRRSRINTLLGTIESELDEYRTYRSTIQK